MSNTNVDDEVEEGEISDDHTIHHVDLTADEFDEVCSIWIYIYMYLLIHG